MNTANELTSSIVKKLDKFQDLIKQKSKEIETKWDFCIWFGQNIEEYSISNLKKQLNDSQCKKVTGKYEETVDLFCDLARDKGQTL